MRHYNEQRARFDRIDGPDPEFGAALGELVWLWAALEDRVRDFLKSINQVAFAATSSQIADRLTTVASLDIALPMHEKTLLHEFVASYIELLRARDTWLQGMPWSEDERVVLSRRDMEYRFESHIEQLRRTASKIRDARSALLQMGDLSSMIGGGRCMSVTTKGDRCSRRATQCRENETSVTAYCGSHAREWDNVLKRYGAADAAKRLPFVNEI